MGQSSRQVGVIRMGCIGGGRFFSNAKEGQLIWCRPSLTRRSKKSVFYLGQFFKLLPYLVVVTFYVIRGSLVKCDFSGWDNFFIWFGFKGVWEGFFVCDGVLRFYDFRLFRK